MGKFVTINESYTYLALYSVLQDMNHFPFPKACMRFRDGDIFVSIFYSAILLNFKDLYLELQILDLGKVFSVDRYSVEFG